MTATDHPATLSIPASRVLHVALSPGGLDTLRDVANRVDSTPSVRADFKATLGEVVGELKRMGEVEMASAVEEVRGGL